MNIFAIEFFDDMQEVGIKTWAGMALAFGLILWYSWGSTTMWLKFGAGIMFINMLGALAVTIWWQYAGRQKHAY
jgi:hypothetical protein